MSCKYFERHFDDYVDGELPEKVKAILDQHVKTCATCRASVEMSNQLRKIVQVPIPPCPPDVVQRAKEKVRLRDSAKRTGFSSISAWLRRPAAAVPAVALVLTAIIVLSVVRHGVSPVGNPLSSRDSGGTMGNKNSLSIGVMVVSVEDNAASSSSLGNKVLDLLRPRFDNVKLYSIKPKARRAIVAVYRRRLQVLDPKDQEEFWPPKEDAVDAVIMVYLVDQHRSFVRIAAADANGRVKFFTQSVKVTDILRNDDWVRNITSWLGTEETAP